MSVSYRRKQVNNASEETGQLGECEKADREKIGGEGDLTVTACEWLAEKRNQKQILNKRGGMYNEKAHREDPAQHSVPVNQSGKRGQGTSSIREQVREKANTWGLGIKDRNFLRQGKEE